jgi:hypothetical protein
MLSFVILSPDEQRQDLPYPLRYPLYLAFHSKPRLRDAPQRRLCRSVVPNTAVLSSNG